MINQNLKLNSSSQNKQLSHKINQLQTTNLVNTQDYQDKILAVTHKNHSSHNSTNSSTHNSSHSSARNHIPTPKPQSQFEQPKSQSFTVENANQNWKRELAQSFKSPVELLKYLNLTPQDFNLDQQVLLKDYQFPMLITKFFVDLMEKGNIHDPLLIQILPLSGELVTRDDFVLQPLDEQDQFVPVNNIVHKYKDRLLFMPKGGCAINCRYCFRRNFPYHELVSAKSDWMAALDYVYDQKIKELILSGGDPLMMSDNEFAWLGEEVIKRNLEVKTNLTQSNQNINDLETYKSDTTINTKPEPESRIGISRLRIHSRLPVVLPNRINDKFIQTCQYLLENQIKVILVTHINHPQELSLELQQKVAQLKSIGVVVLNQSVLLKDINDQASTLAQLSEDLFFAGIMPYYLHLLDKVKGAVHFYVEEAKAHQIYKELQTLVSGYLVPKLAREEVGRPYKTLYGTDYLP